MKDVISVDTIAELFWDGYEHQECDDSCPVAGKYNQAKQALHSLLISKLPDTPENKAVLAEMFRSGDES